ncbi:MAG: hypothetical protein Q4C15_09395 [Eubacteriales bacterium]|nr:hypothetical protein [Eubacteriales bacterium]
MIFLELFFKPFERFLFHTDYLDHSVYHLKHVIGIISPFLSIPKITIDVFDNI